MVNWSELSAPANHGEVLVWPDARHCAEAAVENRARLERCDVPLAGRTLREWRQFVRRTTTGHDDRPVIVTGHQPEFIHAGVWAKHIVSARLAKALQGSAIHLVVDCDMPKQTHLRVPTVREGRVAIVSVPFAESITGVLYEHILKRTTDELTAAQQAVRTALGQRYEDSQMPTLFAGVSAAHEADDWVDQISAGRRTVETRFGLNLDDRRVSRAPWSPVFVEAVRGGPRFVSAYNNALAAYRRDHRVRGTGRPIPDLASDAERFELPFWVFRKREPRRRLWVRPQGNAALLFAESEQIGVVPSHRMNEWAEELATSPEITGWQLRPRALMLTLWARLLLADLFIHGIGGAKYDRITDRLITDYFGFPPPRLACVTATWMLDLPSPTVSPEKVARLRHEFHDLQWNPQRRLPAQLAPDSLRQSRLEAGRRATQLRLNDPRNRRARREAYQEINRLNAALLAVKPELLSTKQRDLAGVREELGKFRLAHDREFFFGLFDRPRLQALCDALPAAGDFRV